MSGDAQNTIPNPAFAERKKAALDMAGIMAKDKLGEQAAKFAIPDAPKTGNLTSQAKLFVNDQGQAMNVMPDENGVFNAPEGFKEKSMAVADKWVAPRIAANDIKKEQFDETQWNKLGKSVNTLSQGARSAAGMAAVGNQRAARALALLDAPNMDSVLLKYVEADLAGIMQGGAPHEQMLRSQGYDNLVTDWAKLKQKVLAEPQSLKIPEIRQQLKETIQGIVAVDNDVLDTNVGINKETFLKAVKQDPERFNRLVGQVNKIKTTGQNTSNEAPQAKQPSSQLDDLAKALGLPKRK